MEMLQFLAGGLVFVGVCLVTWGFALQIVWPWASLIFRAGMWTARFNLWFRRRGRSDLDV